MPSEFTQWTNWKFDLVGSIMSTVGDINHSKLVYFDNPTITGYGLWSALFSHQMHVMHPILLLQVST